MVVLTAFCDETGTDTALTCVGGYVFDHDGEHAFTNKWAEVLRPLRSRGIKGFHASAIEARADEFSALSVAEKLALFGDLIELIRTTAKFGFVSHIEQQIFRQVMKRNKVQSFTGTKYTVCALNSLTFLGKWADEQKYDGKISYRFESGDPSAPEADFMMRQIANNTELAERFRYGGHAFEPKYSLLPLQAADLLVWLWQKAVKDKHRSPYFRNLLREGGVRHQLQPISDAYLNIIAMVNMFYGVKSNRKYETQDGKIRRYTV